MNLKKSIIALLLAISCTAHALSSEQIDKLEEYAFGVYGITYIRDIEPTKLEQYFDRCTIEKQKELLKSFVLSPEEEEKITAERLKMLCVVREFALETAIIHTQPFLENLQQYSPFMGLDMRNEIEFSDLKNIYDCTENEKGYSCSYDPNLTQDGVINEEYKILYDNHIKKIIGIAKKEELMIYCEDTIDIFKQELEKTGFNIINSSRLSSNDFSFLESMYDGEFYIFYSSLTRPLFNEPLSDHLICKVSYVIMNNNVMKVLDI